MNSKSTGLKSIAYELNLSINTVSRALRDCDDISEATKEKVRQKAYELGYIPNNISQFIKRDGKKLITVVVNSFKNSYFSIVCEKLVHIISEFNYDFALVYSQKSKLDLDILKQCISQRVDGIITLLEPEDDVIYTARLNNIPLVMLGRNVDKDYIDLVYTDDKLGGQLAAYYLINFHHLDKFVYIKLANAECSRRRFDAFQKAVKELNSDAEIAVINQNQLNTKLIQLIHNQYYGLFCFNDELAYEALKILNKEIPNVRKILPRLHIVGYDCISTRINGFTDLTSIDFDYDEICHTAVKFLLNRFENIKLEQQKIVFTVKLHQRKYI